MNPVVVVLLLGAIATTTQAQTCVKGTAGTDGTSLDISVVAGTNGCYYQTVSGVTAPLIRCNGTDGGPGVSTTIQVGTGINLGCAFFIGAAGATAADLVCNGTAGAQGLQGNIGPIGLQGLSTFPTLTTVGTASGCLSVVANGSVSICNGTVGLTGIQGIQGLTGGPGNPGFTGLTGTAGAAGSLLPGYFEVDGVSQINGVTIPYTFVGIAKALCYVGCGSTDCSTCGVANTGTGGVVYIGQNCGTVSSPCSTGQQTISAASSGDVLYIPSGVTLDLGGNILGYWPNGCGANIGASFTSIYAGFWNNVVRGGQSATSPAAILSIQQANEGATVINTTASSYISTGLAVGQSCTIGGLLSQEGLGTTSLFTKLVAFNNATGTMTFRDPLPGVCPIGCTVTCVTLASVVRNAGLRNGQFLAQGSCSSGAIEPIVVSQVDGFQMSDIVITGGFPSASANWKGLDISNALDSNFERITIRDLQLTGTVANPCLRFAFSSGTLVADLKITNSGCTTAFFYGAVAYSVVSGVWIDSSTVAAIALTSGPSYNYFTAIDLLRADTGTSNGAVTTDTRTRHNIFYDLSIIGSLASGGAPLYFSNTGDNYNQFYGTQIRGDPGARTVQLTAGVVGNFIEGDFDSTSFFSGSQDPWLSNAFRSLNGPNGHAYWGLRNSTITATDFPATRMYGFYAATDLFTGVAVMGTDSTVRKATITVS